VRIVCIFVTCSALFAVFLLLYLIHYICRILPDLQISDNKIKHCHLWSCYYDPYLSFKITRFTIQKKSLVSLKCCIFINGITTWAHGISAPYWMEKLSCMVESRSKVCLVLLFVYCHSPAVCQCYF